MEKVRNTTVESDEKPLRKMFISILLISVPISLSSIIAAINRLVDTATITRGIEIAFAGGIPAHGSVGAVLNPTLRQLQEEGVRLAGILAKSDTILNLPIAMNISFATVLVPSISAALARGEKKDASRYVSYSLLISILIIMPCAAGFISLGKPIYNMLYPNIPDGYQLLQLSSVALIFIALNQTISGSLQGIGKIYAPATGLLMGCIAKFILNVILIRQTHINIYGAPISSIACQIISFSYGFGVLSRNIPVKLTFIKYILKPLLCAFIMGSGAYFIYILLMKITGINLISTAVSIGAAVIIYFALIFSMRILSEDEILMLPMGNRLAGLLKKIKML